MQLSTILSSLLIAIIPLVNADACVAGGPADQVCYALLSSPPENHLAPAQLLSRPETYLIVTPGSPLFAKNPILKPNFPSSHPFHSSNPKFPLFHPHTSSPPINISTGNNSRRLLPLLPRHLVPILPRASHLRAPRRLNLLQRLSPQVHPSCCMGARYYLHYW
jgi:hypothetical protein